MDDRNRREIIKLRLKGKKRGVIRRKLKYISVGAEALKMIMNKKDCRKITI